LFNFFHGYFSWQTNSASRRHTPADQCIVLYRVVRTTEIDEGPQYVFSYNWRQRSYSHNKINTHHHTNTP